MDGLLRLKKIILTGGPHTGKTTLFNALKKQYFNRKDFAFVSEPATELFSQKQAKTPDTTPTIHKSMFPWDGYNEFSKRVIAKSLELEQAIPTTTTLAILDRSLIDTVAYARLNLCEHILPNLFTLIKQANYTHVLFFDFVGQYTSSTVRNESYHDAIMAHNALREAYKEQTQLHGYQFIEIPSLSITERLLMIQNIIDGVNGA